MQKKTDTEYRSKFAILYREDLEAIEEILLKVPKGYDPSLSYTLIKKAKHKEEYEAKKLNDIPDNISLKEFRLFTHYNKNYKTSYFSLMEDWEKCVRISFTSPDTFLRGKFGEIEDIIKSKEHPVIYYIKKTYWIIYLLFIFSFVPSGPIILSRKTQPTIFIIWLAYSFIVWVLFIAGLISSRLKSINVKQESNGQPLLLRKREELFVLTVAGFISLLIYGLFVLALKHL